MPQVSKKENVEMLNNIVNTKAFLLCLYIWSKKNSSIESFISFCAINVQMNFSVNSYFFMELNFNQNKNT